MKKITFTVAEEVCRKNKNRQQRLTYGDTHGVNPFTGQMSPLGPIPFGKREDDISAIVTYELFQEVALNVVSAKRISCGDIFDYEGKSWVVKGTVTHEHRNHFSCHILAEWRHSLDPSLVEKL